MYSSKILKTVLIPSAVLVANAKTETEKQTNLCRRSDLPLYVPEQTASCLSKQPEATLTLPVPTILEESFGTVREGITGVFKEAQAYKRVAFDYLAQSRENAEWLVKYLRQEDNVTPKAGAIAIGGLTGLIFGLRGRFIKRSLYTIIGATGMAAVCYPREASEYSQTAITESRKYATIAYNFAYGVKKDDPPLELPSLPKIPSSLSDAWDSISKSASSLVSGSEPEQNAEATKAK